MYDLFTLVLYKQHKCKVWRVILSSFIGHTIEWNEKPALFHPIPKQLDFLVSSSFIQKQSRPIKSLIDGPANCGLLKNRPRSEWNFTKFENRCSYRTATLALVSNGISVSGMPRYEVRISYFIVGTGQYRNKAWHVCFFYYGEMESWHGFYSGWSRRTQDPDSRNLHLGNIFLRVY